MTGDTERNPLNIEITKTDDDGYPLEARLYAHYFRKYAKRRIIGGMEHEQALSDTIAEYEADLDSVFFQ